MKLFLESSLVFAFNYLFWVSTVTAGAMATVSSEPERLPSCHLNYPAVPIRLRLPCGGRPSATTLSPQRVAAEEDPVSRVRRGSLFTWLNIDI